MHSAGIPKRTFRIKTEVAMKPMDKNTRSTLKIVSSNIFPKFDSNALINLNELNKH